MEINTENEVIGVPLAQQRRPQESQHNTPVAKKTRSFARLKSTDDDLLAALPKTPSGATSNRLLSETPRRSSRKSVRPAMDYEDIVENSLLRSASKAKNDVAAAPADSAEEEEATAQKWNAAEVGRHSRKRGRKSKRVTSKRAKKEEKEEHKEKEVGKEECAIVEKTLEDKCTMEAEELVVRYTMEVKVQEEECTMKPMEQEELPLQESQAEEDVKESQEEDAQREDSQELKKQEELKLQETHTGEDVKDSQEKDAQREEPQEKDSPHKEQSCEDKVTELNVESVPEIVISSSSPEDANKSVETTVSTVAGVAIEDMDELGLCPLSADESDDKPEEEHNEDMPSLVVLDDEDPTDELNRTFEIDSPTDNGNDAVEQQIDEHEQMDIEMPKLQMSPEKPIKIVLTNENNGDRTLLRMDNSLTSPSAKPYRFPTPFKGTSKMNFKFTAGNTAESLELEESCRGRRRSKSVCSINADKAKTVSFFSPIEVTLVNDIDKRWEKFNISHVTQRRKRSKSLDAPLPKSRIPKPKFVPLIKAPTPVKLKTRTKLPNFAAIHQKQFNKMENLVDHIERKAVRAKELTSSAVKLANNNAQSAQKSSAKKLAMSNVIAAERPRPRAAKKIELLSNLLTPLKPEEILRQKNLPTPRNLIQQQPRSRLPLINKPVQKIFSSISTAPAPSSSSIRKPPPTAAPAPVQSKMEARRQRHMEMFKGRTTKENKVDLIRGVRSNRRFQLQMEHRRQMNEK
ncbi:hypothetical protein ACLKA6_014725 [Drosophila palustris]